MSSALIAKPKPVDVSVAFDLLKKGPALTESDAKQLEARLEKKPDDYESRILLLAYYTSLPSGMDLAQVKAARARHILWIIENDPEHGLGLFQLASGVYEIHCKGDSLADAEAFGAVSKLWLEKLRADPKNTSKITAIVSIRYCDPESAEQVLIAAKDQAGLGRLYADAVLGISGLDYTKREPEQSLPELRESQFARKARTILEAARDPDLVSAAAVALLRNGAILWADGKLEWDYTPLGQQLLATALAQTPDAFQLATVPTQLPPRGERPPSTIRVGGNVQAANLISKVTPRYPPAARAARIDGIVRITALIGLDGRIMRLKPESGPTELVQASLEAVQQWLYKPTLLNGKPCYVITRIDVNFAMH